MQLSQDMQAAKSAAEAMNQAQYDVRVAAQASRQQGNTSLREHMKQMASAKRKLEEQIATAEGVWLLICLAAQLDGNLMNPCGTHVHRACGTHGRTCRSVYGAA